MAAVVVEGQSERRGSIPVSQSESNAFSMLFSTRFSARMRGEWMVHAAGTRQCARRQCVWKSACGSRKEPRRRRRRRKQKENKAASFLCFQGMCLSQTQYYFRVVRTLITVLGLSISIINVEPRPFSRELKGRTRTATLTFSSAMLSLDSKRSVVVSN